MNQCGQAIKVMAEKYSWLKNVALPEAIPPATDTGRLSDILGL